MSEQAIIEAPAPEASVSAQTHTTGYIAPTDPFASKLGQITDGRQSDTPPVQKEPPVTKEPAKADRSRDDGGRFAPKDQEPAKSEPTKEESKAEEKPAPTKSDLIEKLSRGEDIEVPQKKSPADKPNPGEKGYQRWSEQEKALKDTRAELETLRKELEETRGKIPADYEDLKKTNEEYTRERQARDVTARPEFQQNIVQPIKRNFDSLIKVGKELQLDEYKLRAAIDEPDELKRATMLHNMISSLDEPPQALGSIVAQMNLKAEEIHALRSEGDEYIKNAPDILANLQADDVKRQTEEKQKSKEAYDKAAGLALQILEDDEHGIPHMKDPAIKKAAQEAAKADWDTLKPGARAYVMIAGGILSQVIEKGKAESAAHKEALEGKDRELASLKLQLQKLSGASPSPSSAPPAAISSPSSSSKDPFGDKIKKGL
jgi:myosin heavy subunit